MYKPSPEQLSQSIWDASASRYLTGTSCRTGYFREALEWILTYCGGGGTAAGTVVLLYDHIITLPDEYRFVWKANPSFAKYAFLLNRYVVPSVMLLVLSGTSETRERMDNSRANGEFDPSTDSDLWFRTCPVGSAVRSC